jgi:hypothetical protein
MPTARHCSALPNRAMTPPSYSDIIFFGSIALIAIIVLCAAPWNDKHHLLITFIIRFPRRIGSPPKKKREKGVWTEYPCANLALVAKGSCRYSTYKILNYGYGASPILNPDKCIFMADSMLVPMVSRSRYFFQKGAHLLFSSNTASFSHRSSVGKDHIV